MKTQNCRYMARCRELRIFDYCGCPKNLESCELPELFGLNQEVGDKLRKLDRTVRRTDASNAELAANLTQRASEIYQRFAQG